MNYFPATEFFNPDKPKGKNEPIHDDLKEVSMVEFQPGWFFLNDNAQQGDSRYIQEVNGCNADGNKPELMFPISGIGDDKTGEHCKKSQSIARIANP